MSTTELLLIDLSGIAHQIYHVSGNEPDPSYISTQVIARVRSLASAHPHAAICCDSGASFRRDLDPTYKANRDTANRAPLKHQMTVACETLAKDGFPVWSAPGFEADDVIATATMKALAIDDTTVLIASADKDLLQLVGERVRQKKIQIGAATGPEIFGPREVFEKFGVYPAQMLDMLCLVGDTSDNIKGAVGIGAKTAAELLKTHGTLENLYAAIDKGVVPGVTPAKRTALVEFRERWPLVRKLVALRTDVTGFEFAEVAVEREAAPMVEDAPAMEDAMTGSLDRFDAALDAALQSAGASTASNPARQGEMSAADATAALGKATEAVKARIAEMPEPRQPLTAKPQDATNAIVATQGTAIAPIVDFSQELEPRSIEDAKAIARYAFASRLFSSYGTEQAVLMVIMAGRELGMSAMTSLRGFHLVEGRPTLSADLIRALIIRSGKAKYFRPTERTATRATWETQRGDDPPVSLTFTIEEAHQAGVVKKGSGWEKFPADMLTARASAKLARLVYSDIVFNLYDPSEVG